MVFFSFSGVELKGVGVFCELLYEGVSERIGRCSDLSWDSRGGFIFFRFYWVFVRFLLFFLWFFEGFSLLVIVGDFGS